MKLQEGGIIQARPHWQVANGCWGLIDCFASGGGACEAGWLCLGTWNKVNEVTTGVVATRQTWAESEKRLLVTSGDVCSPCSATNKEFVTPTSWESGGFRGYVQLLHIWDTSLKNTSNRCCNCKFLCLNVLHEKGNSVNWSRIQVC